jgi:DNA-binding phage protein
MKVNGDFDIRVLRAVLEAQMNANGIKRKTLSKKAGLNEQAVRDILSKTDNPQVGTLLAIAKALEMPASALFGQIVPIIGRVTGSGVIVPRADGDGSHNYAVRPPAGMGEIVALIVEGNGMMPAFRDGEIIYAERADTDTEDDFIGTQCVVRLKANDEMLIKMVAKGSEPGLYTLRDWRGDDIENVPLAWAAPITFTTRKRVKNNTFRL